MDSKPLSFLRSAWYLTGAFAYTLHTLTHLIPAMQILYARTHPHLSNPENLNTLEKGIGFVYQALESTPGEIIMYSLPLLVLSDVYYHHQHKKNLRKKDGQIKQLENEKKDLEQRLAEMQKTIKNQSF